MAFLIKNTKPLNAVECIVSGDDALDLDKCDFEEYRKTLDEKHLSFLPEKEPTRFIMNFELKGKESELIKNAMMAGKDSDGNMTMALGSWSFKVVKYTLKKIVNPDSAPLEQQLILKMDGKGGVSDDFLALLDRMGILQELFSFYISLVHTPERAHVKN